MSIERSAQELASIFDDRGDVFWNVSPGRGTITQIVLLRLDEATALFMRNVFGGILTLKVKAGGYDWRCSGETSTQFGEWILPYVKRKQAVLSMYIEARKHIGSKGRGRGSVLSKHDQEFRRVIAAEIMQLKQQLRESGD